MWCYKCNSEAFAEICDKCGNTTENNIPSEIYWCSECKVPIIKLVNDLNKNTCPLCSSKTNYMCTDLRPVFPQERLLMGILQGKPLFYLSESVWRADNRCYINGISQHIPLSLFRKANSKLIKEQLEEYSLVDIENFNDDIDRFIRANRERLLYLKNEAFSFIRSTASNFPQENIVVSFSGGKDSSVVSDLVMRSLSNPSMIHIFGDTTLEFPSTIEYAKRFRENNPKTIIKIAKNKEQDFYTVCEDIGPPSRLLRWCCSMFKTGPITRVLNNLFRDNKILTFYGIRRCESVSRSKYNRLENDAEVVKIQKQTVASPIFFWNDIDVWLYLLGEKVEFNDAYKLGYDRVGCWCCPNNNTRDHFLSRIYMQKESEEWRNFLIEFARSIGKQDAEEYVDTGKWKARQGGNGLESADDIKINFHNCTTEENAKIYRLKRPISESFYSLFTPLGIVSKELGRKLIKETLVLDPKNKVPIISIQPFNQEGYDYAVKIMTMNVKDHEELHRRIAYQVRKYNACRRCLKCESLCKYGAISITEDGYWIDSLKCKRCKMCVTAKYLDGGCLMAKVLRTKME